MASFWFNKGLERILTGNLDLDTVTSKVLLLTSTTTSANWTVTHDTTTIDTGGANDIVDDEIAAAGYSRQTASVSVQIDNTNDHVEVVLSDITFSSVASGETVKAAILHTATGADTVAIPLVYWDVTDTATNGGDITLDFSTGGNARVSTT